MKTAKKHAAHGITQFELTQKLLNNLSQFKLTPTAKLVLLELSACYNPNKPDMFPKQKTLADKIGVSEASVIRAISELHKEGVIISERKYTRRYKFTSRIVEETPHFEKIFKSDNLQPENLQFENEKLAICKVHEHEPIKEQKKEPDKVEDFKILKDYAERNGAKNITAYINALKKNGSAQKIIAGFKEKQASERWHAKHSEETRRNREEVRNLETASYEDCEKLKEVLMKNWGIKRA